MGFLDFLFDKEKAHERKLAKLKKTATHMYVQPPERKYALEQLRDIGDEEAIWAMLARFGENAPNTTVDIDEKRWTYETLVEMATDPSKPVEKVIREYLHEAEEKINWPMKVMSDLLDYEEMAELVREVLAGCDTGYQRSPEKKQELLLQAGELAGHEGLLEEVERFAEDDNETIRFHAVDVLLKHTDHEGVVDLLRDRLTKEDSLRINKRLAEAFADHKEWSIPDDEREDVERMLPDEFGVHKQGHVYRKRT